MTLGYGNSCTVILNFTPHALGSTLSTSKPTIVTAYSLKNPLKPALLSGTGITAPVVVTAKTTAPTYHWTTGAVDACTGGSGTFAYSAWGPTCGNGTVAQSRTATCLVNPGSGIQHQTVTCVNSDNVTVANSHCTGTPPVVPMVASACTPAHFSCGEQGLLARTVSVPACPTLVPTHCVSNPAAGIYCATVN